VEGQPYSINQTLSADNQSPVIARSRFPGKTVVKASLFDDISRPVKEIYTDRKQEWLQAIEGAEQN